MHVALRGDEVLVPRELLYGASRCAPHRHMGTEAVTQSVYAVVLETSSTRRSLDAVLDDIGRQRRSIRTTQHPLRSQMSMIA